MYGGHPFYIQKKIKTVLFDSSLRPATGLRYSPKYQIGSQ